MERIVVHALGLKITAAHVQNAAGERRDAVKGRASVTFVHPVSGETRAEELQSAAVMDETAQTATFSFGTTLAKGAWELVAEYEGSLMQPGLEGFYRTMWTDNAGTEHWAASTQFEATHAGAPSRAGMNRRSRRRTR